MEPIRTISLERVSLVNRRGTFPHSREVLIGDVAAEFDAARKARQPVVLKVDCPGGSATAAVDLVVLIEEFRAAGLHVVVEVTGRAESAAALFILGASHVAMWPWARVGLHRERSPASPPAELPEIQWLRPEAYLDLCPRLSSPARALLEKYTPGTPAQIDSWLGDSMLYLRPEEALAAGFVDEVIELGPDEVIDLDRHPDRAREVALALARGEAVRSPRQEALEALGRGAAMNPVAS